MVSNPLTFIWFNKAFRVNQPKHYQFTIFGGVFFQFLARQFGCSEFCSDSEKWRRNIFPSFYCSRWPMKLIHFQRLAAKSWSSEDCLFLCDDRLHKVAKLRLKENAKNQSSKMKREKWWNVSAFVHCIYCLGVIFVTSKHCYSKYFVCFFLRAWNC